MNDAYIRQIVREEISKSNSGGRFNIQNLPYHTHNGVDAPFALQPLVTYIGLIGFHGTVGILPTGWTAVYGSTGQYQVTHNLGTIQYVVVASAAGNAAFVDITNDDKLVEFDWFNAASAAQDTPFYFTLSVANNRKVAPPTYQTTTYTQTGQLT